MKAVSFLAWRGLLFLLLSCLGGLAPAASVSEVLRGRLEPLLGSHQPLRLAGDAAPQAVAEFYAARNWAPAWDEPRYQSLLRSLDGLAGDGLDPEDYGFSALRSLGPTAEPELAAEREIRATRACLLALLHLYRGKVDPLRLDPHWNFEARQIDPEQGLKLVQAAVTENRVEDIFDRARPVWPLYDRLRIALGQLRRLEQQGGWPELPEGPVLKPGMNDVRVPLLRRRLQLAGLLPAGEVAAPEFYDGMLQQAVQRFQREANLEPDGSIGPATRNELNIPVAARIAQLRVNLERLRWFRSELNGDTVVVDLAGFRIFFLREGAVKWTSRVQVGREYRPSPVFRSAITYLTLSPGWVVPPTIFREDALPTIRRNRGYLARQKLHIFNAAGQEIPASAVNWGQPGNITLRQEPGPDGALGELAIRFDNPFSVYLHDTPHKELFASSRRTTSSGCIRVENVHDLAVLLLDDPVHWSRDALQAAINERKTRTVTLKRAVPILLGYWTAQVDPDGYVAFRPDIYHRDPPLLQALDQRP